MGDIIANKGSISGDIEKGKSLQAGEVARNTGGTHNYENLINLPEVNGETLIGDKSSEDLHIVAVKTSAEWAALTTLQSRQGEIYVYSDGAEDGEGNPIPMIKIGDGNAYVVDLPFATATDIRITDEDIQNWNNKVSVRADGETLIFY